MDYEFRMRQLEEEMRHAQAMEKLKGERLDVQDRSIEAIREIQKQFALDLEATRALVAETAALVKVLVTALIGERQNGKG